MASFVTPPELKDIMVEDPCVIQKIRDLEHEFGLPTEVSTRLQQYKSDPNQLILEMLGAWVSTGFKRTVQDLVNILEKLNFKYIVGKLNDRYKGKLDTVILLNGGDAMMRLRNSNVTLKSETTTFNFNAVDELSFEFESIPTSSNNFTENTIGEDALVVYNFPEGGNDNRLAQSMIYAHDIPMTVMDTVRIKHEEGVNPFLLKTKPLAVKLASSAESNYNIEKAADVLNRSEKTKVRHIAVKTFKSKKTVTSYTKNLSPFARNQILSEVRGNENSINSTTVQMEYQHFHMNSERFEKIAFGQLDTRNFNVSKKLGSPNNNKYGSNTMKEPALGRRGILIQLVNAFEASSKYSNPQILCIYGVNKEGNSEVAKTFLGWFKDITGGNFVYLDKSFIEFGKLLSQQNIENDPIPLCEHYSQSGTKKWLFIIDNDETESEIFLFLEKFLIISPGMFPFFVYTSKMKPNSSIIHSLNLISLNDRDALFTNMQDVSVSIVEMDDALKPGCKIINDTFQHLAFQVVGMHGMQSSIKAFILVGLSGGKDFTKQDFCTLASGGNIKGKDVIKVFKQRGMLVKVSGRYYCPPDVLNLIRVYYLENKDFQYLQYQLLGIATEYGNLIKWVLNTVKYLKNNALAVNCFRSVWHDVVRDNGTVTSCVRPVGLLSTEDQTKLLFEFKSNFQEDFMVNLDLEMLEKTYYRFLNICGPKDELLWKIGDYLGDQLTAKDKYESAAKLFSELIAYKGLKYGKTNPIILETQELLVKCYCGNKMYLEAAEVQRELVHATEVPPSKNARTNIMCRIELAQILEQAGDSEKAIDVLEMAYSICNSDKHKYSDLINTIKRDIDRLKPFNGIGSTIRHFFGRYRN